MITEKEPDIKKYGAVRMSAEERAQTLKECVENGVTFHPKR